MPPAERSSTAGSRRWVRSGSRAGDGHAATLTSRGRQAAARRGAPWARRPASVGGDQRGIVRRPGGRARHLPLALVSSPEPPSRAAAAGRRPAGPGPAPADRARGAASPPRGTSSRWSAGRCATRSSAGCRRTWTSPRRDPRPDRAHARRLGATRTGTSGRDVRHDRRPQRGAHHRRGDDLPRRRLRPGHAQAGGGLRRQPRATTWSGATSPSTRWRCGCRRWSSSTRTTGWPTWRRGCCAPRARPRSRSPTTRCG